MCLPFAAQPEYNEHPQVCSENAREVARKTEHEGWYARASSYDGIVLRIRGEIL